ncbi:MAG: hypothetical protein ACE14P_03445 [Methanotrichaceae archaeon]
MRNACLVMIGIFALSAIAITFFGFAEAQSQADLTSINSNIIAVALEKPNKELPTGQGTWSLNNQTETQPISELSYIKSGVLIAKIHPMPPMKPTAPVVISFEDLSGGDNVFHQYAYQGIEFNYPRVIDYPEEAAPWRYQGFAHSGTKAIEQCYGGEFCTKPIQMNFTNGQRHVKVWVGYSDNLAGQRTVLMRAFDSTGAQIGQATAILQPSASPTPIQTSMEVTSDSANIKKVIINFAPQTYGESQTNHLSVDDVEFDSSGPAPSCNTAEAPSVKLTQPASGQVVRGNMFNLQGTVSTAAPLESATLIVTGSSGSNSMNLLSDNTFPRSGGTFSVNGIQDMLSLGSNTVIVRVQNCAGSGESSTTLNLQPCDSTTSPIVTIIEPNPASLPGKNIVSSLSPTFKLKSRVDSISDLESVTVTTTAGLPTNAGTRYLGTFTGNPLKSGDFNLNINTNDLFPGENTITVTAKNIEGCSGEASTSVIFERRMYKRISGESYFQLSQGDSNDKYIAKNGRLYVSHDPGCGVSGNNGDDVFFASNKLPFWCKLVGVEFHQFWPTVRRPDDCGIGALFGGGSYLTKLTHDDLFNDSKVTVHWENACCGRYSGKNIEYVISFIVSVPDDMIGLSLGEPLFSLTETSANLIQPPNGFGLYEQPAPPETSAPKSPAIQEHWFYFEMTNPQSWVKPCFPIAELAPDEQTAANIAEAENQPYKANPISYETYMQDIANNACS